jgi:hypothetical protein
LYLGPTQMKVRGIHQVFLTTYGTSRALSLIGILILENIPQHHTKVYLITFDELFALLSSGSSLPSPSLLRLHLFPASRPLAISSPAFLHFRHYILTYFVSYIHMT